MENKIYFLGFAPEDSEFLCKLIEAMYGKKYSISIIYYQYELKKIEAAENPVFVIFINELNIEQRRVVWQLKTNYPTSPFVISSPDFMVANYSWQINATFFLPHPFSRRSIALMFHNIDGKRATPKVRIKFNYQGGFELVSADDICYCEGDGNYTTIFLRNSKSVLLSKKIKDIYQKLSQFPQINRIGKSYIVNVDNIIKVDDYKVYFKGFNERNVEFQISQVYLKRIKGQLLLITT